MASTSKKGSFKTPITKSAASPGRTGGWKKGKGKTSEGPKGPIAPEGVSLGSEVEWPPLGPSGPIALGASTPEGKGKVLVSGKGNEEGKDEEAMSLASDSESDVSDTEEEVIQAMRSQLDCLWEAVACPCPTARTPDRVNKGETVYFATMTCLEGIFQSEKEKEYDCAMFASGQRLEEVKKELEGKLQRVKSLEGKIENMVRERERVEGVLVREKEKGKERKRKLEEKLQRKIEVRKSLEGKIGKVEREREKMEGKGGRRGRGRRRENWKGSSSARMR